MSLETLLEAAQFLESHGKGVDLNDTSEDGSRTVSDLGTSREESLDSFIDGSGFKQPKSKPKSGKMSPIIVSPSDSYFMRAGTREVHNKLEKNRRAHLKECFDFLKKNIPSLEDKRTSNLGILRSSLRYIQNLKRREREFEQEMQKFAREKILLQQKMGALKTELNTMNIDVDMNAWSISEDQDNETNSTSTATERGTPPPSDYDENDDDEEEAERLVMETNPSPIPKKHKKMFKDFPNPVHKPVPHLTPKQSVPTLNGFLTTPDTATTSLSTVKKTVPIMLTSSGPVQQIPLSMICPSTQPVGVMAPNQPSGLVTADSMSVSRMPVTKILHRTLTQRQALMKQAGSSSQVSAAPLTAAQLRTPPQPRPHTFLTMTTPSQTTTTIKKDINSTVQSVSAGQQVTQATAAIAGTLPLTFPYYMTSLPKIAHPILVTSLMTPAMGVAATTASSVIGTSAGTLATASTVAMSSKGDMKLKPEPAGATLTSLAATHSDTTVVSSTPPAGLQQQQQQQQALQSLFAPNLLQRPVAWPFLAGIPRTTVVMATTTSSQPAPPLTLTSAQPASSQVTTIPLASLAQLNQLSQMVAPVTVNSTGLQMAPALSQSQLNAMLSTQLLKQFQIPFGIPSTLLQPGQVLGQQVMKPVVVVTVPNVVTQSQPTLAANMNLASASSTTPSSAL